MVMNRATAHLLPMPERIAFWKNERQEWLQLMDSSKEWNEIRSCYAQVSVIDKIIDKLEYPHKHKQMLAMRCKHCYR